MDIIDSGRPWGSFRQFTKNEVSTVKVISVNPGERLSLQFHNNRDEFWRVLSGSGKFVIGDKVHEVSKGDEFFIPKLAKHRMIAETKLEVLEISFGEFDENDIIRLEDQYNRK